MSKGSPRHAPRRTVFINPRFQGGIALCFAAAILAVTAMSGWFFHIHTRDALRAASLKGHYNFLFPYEILGGALLRYVAALSAVGAASCMLVFMLIRLRIRRGVDRLANAFRLSVDGDLSTPTEVAGPADLSALGRNMDKARARTLSMIREAREEVQFLRNEPLSEEEFAKRWDALRRDLERIAP